MRNVNGVTAGILQRLENAQRTRARLTNETPDRGDQTQTPERLRGDAVRVDLSSDVRIRAARANAHRLRESTSASEPQAVRPEKPVFYPGATIEGTYAGGEFSTSDGKVGSYHGMDGGQIKFEIDGFQGYLVNPHKAVAYNPSTGESYQMNVRYGNGKFQIAGVEPLSSERTQYDTSEPLLKESDNAPVKFEYGDDGKLSAVFYSAFENQRFQAEGFLDKNGTYV
ncbi:MAG: hypothetical protein KDD53_08010, partial [Bdellovibrionales bacterium]|nr:hypothetical protein [Bdellovibrionales bacterium]